MNAPYHTITACDRDANAASAWDRPRSVPQVTARVDMDAVNRVADECAAHLATLSPERRAQLERDWDDV